MVQTKIRFKYVNTLPSLQFWNQTSEYVVRKPCPATNQIVSIKMALKSVDF